MNSQNIVFRLLYLDILRRLFHIDALGGELVIYTCFIFRTILKKLYTEGEFETKHNPVESIRHRETDIMLKISLYIALLFNMVEINLF